MNPSTTPSSTSSKQPAGLRGIVSSGVPKYTVMGVRPSWDEITMTKCLVTSFRSTCDRGLCATVILDRFHRDVASGYNGSPPGHPHCSGENGIGHLFEDESRIHCIRTIHDTINAVLQVDDRSRLQGSTFYSTYRPCIRCANVIASSRAWRVVYLYDYISDDSERAETILTRSGVVIERFAGRILLL